MILSSINEDGEKVSILAFPYESNENIFEKAARKIAQKEGIELFIGMEFIALCGEDRIIARKIKSSYSFICFLHEVGHITFFRQKREFDHLLFEELLCWQYAFKKFKEFYQLKWEDVKKCLQDFNTYVEVHGLDPSWRSEILKLRKKIFAL